MPIIWLIVPSPYYFFYIFFIGYNLQILNPPGKFAPLKYSFCVHFPVTGSVFTSIFQPPTSKSFGGNKKKIYFFELDLYLIVNKNKSLIYQIPWTHFTTFCKNDIGNSHVCYKLTSAAQEYAEWVKMNDGQ